MTDDQWRTSLDDLKRERDNLDPKDDRARRSVDQLIKDVKLHLAADERERKAEHEAALSERLAAATREFEATHPKLTLLLNRIMMELSATGV